MKLTNVLFICDYLCSTQAILVTRFLVNLRSASTKSTDSASTGTVDAELSSFRAERWEDGVGFASSLLFAEQDVWDDDEDGDEDENQGEPDVPVETRNRVLWTDGTQGVGEHCRVIE